MSSKPSLILKLRALGWALNLTRLNVILLILTTVLLSVAQGQDLLLSMLDGEPFEDLSAFNKRLSLYGSTALWAVSIWLWARVLLNIEYKDAPVSPALLLPYRKQLPRLLGVLAFTVVAFNLDQVGHTASAMIVVAEGIAFWIFVWKRRSIGRLIANNDDNHWAFSHEINNPKHPHLYPSLFAALDNVLGRIALFTIALGIVLFIWGMASPIGLGNTLDTLLLLMLWSATVLPLGSLVTYWGNRRGYPVVVIGIIAIVAFSAFNDNHQIRLLATNDGGSAINNRPAINDALAEWRSKNCSNGNCKRFIVVATAGGGIRAAYWTGTVLGQLHDHNLDGRFNEQLFAVSGVSGGSVGATVYRAVSAIDDKQNVTESIQKVLGKDYLGPVSAGLLYADAVQRLLPFDILYDRAEVFEQSLELGFRENLSNKVNGLDSSFVQSARFIENRPWPALFLNSTWSENGRRIVASTLKNAQGVLYKDLLNTLGSDMRLSTAAHNSARFPLVSPAGGWVPVDAPESNDKGEKKVTWQRLQDGGLFENYGAETALEILEIAEENFAKASVPFKPFVILISSDPNLFNDLAEFHYNKPVKLAPEVLSTFNTYAKVRLGRGAEAASRLKAWADNYGDQDVGSNKVYYASFRMCPSPNDLEEPPLGWALSKKSQIEIASYLHESCKGHSNAEAFQNTLSVLK